MKTSQTKPKLYDNGLSKTCLKALILPKILIFDKQSLDNVVHDMNMKTMISNTYITNDSIMKLLNLFALLSSENEIKKMFSKLICINYYEDQLYAFEFIKRYLEKSVQSFSPCFHMCYINLYDILQEIILEKNIDYNESYVKIKDILEELIAYCIKNLTKNGQIGICLDFSNKSIQPLISRIKEIILKFFSNGDVIFIFFIPIKKDEQRTIIKGKDSIINKEEYAILVQFNYDDFKRDILRIKFIEYNICDSKGNTLLISDIDNWLSSLKHIKL